MFLALKGRKWVFEEISEMLFIVPDDRKKNVGA